MLERFNVVLYFLKLTSFLSHYGFYCFYLQLLKRRNSVLDSDIGSVGPIRRIRHKPNLLSSKSLCTAIGGSPLPATGTGARSDMPLSLIEKPHMLGESNPKFSKTLMESGDISRPGVSFAHVPSQSSEMAEKILPQLAACMSYSRVDPTTTMKVCWGKNITRRFFTLLLVFQSSLFCLSVRVLHRHLMFMVDHHHLSLHWSKIEFLGLNKGYTCLRD